MRMPAWIPQERPSTGSFLFAASLLFWLSFAVFEGLRMRYLYQPVGFRQVLLSLAFYGVFAWAMTAIASLAWSLSRRLRAPWPRNPDALLFAINFMALVALISQTEGSSAPWRGWGWMTLSFALLIGAAGLGVIASERNRKVTVLLTSTVPIATVWLCFPSVPLQLVELNLSWFLIPVGLGFAPMWCSQRVTAAPRYRVALLVPLLVLLVAAAHILYASNVGHVPKRVGAEGGKGETGGPRPDVLLVVLDTVRADRIGSYGYTRPVSPHLDWLADRSDRYEYAYSAHTRTPESHRSLFTGRYAEYSETKTIAEDFRGLGYSTIALSANRLALPADMHRGFDRIAPGVHNLPGAHREAAVRALLAPIPLLGQRNWFDNRWVIGDVYYPRATAMVDMAVSSLDASDGPTFLFLNLMDAHDPYRPPQKYAELFPGYDPALRYDSGPILRLIRDDSRTTMYTIQQAAHVGSQYDGEIAYVDSELGRLFRYLQQTGRFERSLIMVTSDHGEGLGAHGFPTHGWEPYEEQTRVPLLIKHPGQGAGRIINGLWSLVDVKPIVLDSVRGAEPTAASDEGKLVLSVGGGLIGVRKGPWKLLVGTQGQLRELYDLSQDPSEEHQLLNASTTRCCVTGPRATNALAVQLAEEGLSLASASGLLKPNMVLRLQDLGLLRSLGYLSHFRWAGWRARFAGGGGDASGTEVLSADGIT